MIVDAVFSYIVGKVVACAQLWFLTLETSEKSAWSLSLTACMVMTEKFPCFLLLPADMAATEKFPPALYSCLNTWLRPKRSPLLPTPACRHGCNRKVPACTLILPEQKRHGYGRKGRVAPAPYSCLHTWVQPNSSPLLPTPACTQKTWLRRKSSRLLPTPAWIHGYEKKNSRLLPTPSTWLLIEFSSSKDLGSIFIYWYLFWPPPVEASSLCMNLRGGKKGILICLFNVKKRWIPFRF